MEPFLALVMLAIALEAFVQLLKNFWDVDARSGWNITAVVVVLIPVLAAFKTETNLVAESGFDFDQPFLGYLISGLVVARIAQWVHAIYKKTT